jgi:mRNA interferase MazF
MRRGEVYFVDLDPVVGREQSGVRPVVVVSIDELNAKPLVVMVVPGTSSPSGLRSRPSSVIVPAGEGGLTRDTGFLCLHVRGLDHSRFPANPVGTLSDKRMQEIALALGYCLGL